MTSPTLLVCELGASIGVSNALANAVNADALITALITFGVSVVTLVGGELIKYLVAFFKKKTKIIKEQQ